MGARWRETQSRNGLLSRVFTRDSEGQLFNTMLARLCVLYEDLNIEIRGAAAADLGALDVLHPRSENIDNPGNIGFYRRLYFFRRIIGTLYEFSDALISINREAQLKEIFDRPQNEDLRILWAESVAYFKREKNQLAKVRNDVGGHFGTKAARFAVENMPENAVGRIQITTSTNGREPQLHFATEIASTGLLHHLQGRDTSEKVGLFLNDYLIDGSRQATNAVHLLTIAHLLPLFGK